MVRRLDTGEPEASDPDLLAHVESSAVAALVRLVGYWTSEDFQGLLAERAGVKVESRDVPALFMLARLNPVRPSVLAHALHVSAGNVSRTLQRLGSLGYTIRTADPEDARASLVSLTQSGSDRATLLSREGERLFGELLRPWPSTEIISFSAMLVRFADAVGAPDA